MSAVEIMESKADLVSYDQRPGAVVPIEKTAVTLMDLLQQAVATGNMAMAERLMAMDERVEARNARAAFNAALAAAKAEIKPITKNRHVGFDSRKAGAARTDYKHEDLAGIASEVDPVLSKNGLGYRFRAKAVPGEPVVVVCILFHRLGHEEAGEPMSANVDATGNKNPIQQMGSAVTYLQRYTLKAALGLAAAHDDDGRSAGISTNGGDEPVNEEQLATLKTRLMELEADLVVFFKMLKIERIEDVRVRDLPVAKRALDELAVYRKRQAEEAERKAKQAATKGTAR